MKKIFGIKWWILMQKEGPERIISKEAVIRALSKMRRGKAAGQSGVVSEMLKASGETE